MVKLSKRFKKIAPLVSREKIYTLEEALKILQEAPPTKFDQSVEVSIQSGLDVKKSDQQIRGTLDLPHGTGKKVRILVFAKGEKVKEAEEAGAEYVGSDELLAKVAGGWVDFDVVVSTPDMMREVGKLGKVLGPRGLMPTPKAGTVATDLRKAVTELKAGRIEFKSDKNGQINNMVGKLSFERKQLIENTEALISAVVRAKPSSAKGQYILSVALSSTMGPGIKINTSTMTR